MGVSDNEQGLAAGAGSRVLVFEAYGFWFLGLGFRFQGLRCVWFGAMQSLIQNVATTSHEVCSFQFPGYDTRNIHSIVGKFLPA